MNARLRDRLRLEEELRRALSVGEFCLRYQLQVNREGQAVAAGTFLRWNHPREGMLLPEAFIHFAEETGMLVAIGQWTLKSACYQLRQWTDCGLPITRLAIRVSLAELLSPDFIASVRDSLAAMRLHPAHLQFEMGGEAPTGGERLATAAEMARKADLRLAINPVAGPSLASLARLPISQFRFDHAFMRELEMDGATGAIAAASVELARKLGIGIIAQGVETARQSEMASALGCDWQQGGYFSGPLAAGDIPEAISALARRSL